MALRSMTDTMNGMIQATGRIQRLGVFSFFTLLVSFAFSYVTIAVLGLGINGYCLALFFYEFASLLICVYFYYFELEEEIRDTSISILENLGWYVWEVLKTTSGTMYNVITRELVMLIITVAKEPNTLATFTVI